ncbi:hypothetical protein ACHAPT_011896 [Fusarium lateritium]
MCEKPISVDVITTEEVLAKAKSKPHLKFLYRAAKEMVENGSLGEIHAVETTCLDQQDPTGFFVTFSAQSGGIFVDMGVHDIDIGRYYLDVKSGLTNPKQVNRVIAMGQQAVYGELAKYGGCDNGWAMVEFANGKVLTSHLGRTLTNGFESCTRVCGTKAHSLVNGNSAINRVKVRGIHSVRAATTPGAFVLCGKSFLSGLAGFATAVLGGKPLTCTPDGAYGAAKIATALQYSFRNRVPVYFGNNGLPVMGTPKAWKRWQGSWVGIKQGIYTEWYASTLELNIWTKSSVVKAKQDSQGNWTVVIDKEGKETRTLHLKHVVMATSLCGIPMLPAIPGMTDFRGGVIRHSTTHDSARDFVGKKVCVVGTSSSGFDTAYDCARRGIDVTLLQWSPTYIISLTHSVPRIIGNYTPDADLSRPDLEEMDRLFFATPTSPSEEFNPRGPRQPLLEALNARGLRTWRGQRGTGNSTLGQTRNGGFYFDACACEHVINGNIKVEPGYIERFTEDNVILNDNREREFDLIVFATGFTNTIDSVRGALGGKIAEQCGPIWGIDEEGEFKTAYRDTGVPNLWVLAGYLPYTRYHSKLLDMRLKALKEGVASAPYTAHTFSIPIALSSPGN